MKRMLIFMTCWLSAFIYASAYTVLDTSTGQIVETDELPQVSRTVERLTNGTKVTYEFSGIVLMADPLVSGAFYPVIEGFGQVETEKEAWVPVKVDRFCVSDTAACTVQILNSEYIEVNLRLSPARAHHAENEEFEYTSENLPSIPSWLGYFPKELVSCTRNDVYRDAFIKSVKISPISYFSRLQKTRVYKSFSYLVEDENVESVDGVSARQIVNDPIMAGLTTNEGTGLSKLQPIRYSIPAPMSYLIISHTSLTNEVSQLGFWKRRMGYKVTLELDDNWTPEKIKQAVKRWYDSNQDAYYLLIVGDHNLVPAEIYPQFEDVEVDAPYTDLYYACMDGPDDHMPDLCYGRIPVSTSAELKAVYDKILNYEGFRNDSQQESKFVGVAMFQDTPTRVAGTNELWSDGIEDRDYVRTVEVVTSELEKVFGNVERIYCTNGNVVPNSWSKETVGLSFPDYLKDVSAWNGNTQQIVDAINSGCNLVLHRDHGLIDGWHLPSFKTKDLSGLKNTVYPIVLSMNCQTGDFTSGNNFAKSILTRANSGAVAVVGATTDSYTYRNDIITLAMMKSIWPQLNFKSYTPTLQFKDDYDTPVNSLGEAFAVGMTKMEEAHPEPKNYNLNLHQRREYHCLGDPSLNICWKSDDYLRESLSVTYENGVGEISLGNMQSAYISIWDAANGQMLRYYGNHVVYETWAPEAMVTVRKNGYLPITFTFYGYMASSSSDFSSAKLKDAVFNGDELNIEVENGDSGNYNVAVSEADNMMILSDVSVEPVQSGTANYRIKNTSNRFFFVTLRKGEEIIESKTIYKTN